MLSGCSARAACQWRRRRRRAPRRLHLSEMYAAFWRVLYLCKALRVVRPQRYDHDEDEPDERGLPRLRRRARRFAFRRGFIRRHRARRSRPSPPLRAPLPPPAAAGRGSPPPAPPGARPRYATSPLPCRGGPCARAPARAVCRRPRARPRQHPLRGGPPGSSRRAPPRRGWARPAPRPPPAAPRGRTGAPIPPSRTPAFRSVANHLAAPVRPRHARRVPSNRTAEREKRGSSTSLPPPLSPPARARAPGNRPIPSHPY